MNTMGKASTRSPIPTSIQGTPGCSAERKAFDELDYRTDHFVSAATGHQQSNRGGGSSGAATYWEVRTAKMADQARAPVRDTFSR